MLNLIMLIIAVPFSAVFVITLPFIIKKIKALISNKNALFFD